MIENERLRLRDCKTILEDDGLKPPDQPSFLDDVEDELEDTDKDKADDDKKVLDKDKADLVKDKKTKGPLKAWGGRAKFSKGSAMRVENKAFIKNQLEKEDYINRDADYYHGGATHGYNSDYNSYYTPVTKRRKKADRSFNTFTCSTFDYDCLPCTKYEDIHACDKHQFCYEKGGKGNCHTCAKYGKHCQECNLMMDVQTVC